MRRGSETAAARSPQFGFDLLVCPQCNNSLETERSALICLGCSSEYPVIDGIPILLPEAATSGPNEPRHRQAEFYDEQVDDEFEIMRPLGAPQMYRWLFDQKFKRSIRGIEELLPGCTALSVCGGSGLDAEFLARRGARVIVSDISLGAMKRAQERGRRRSLPLFPIVADVERLPFRSQSIDLIYVHDGLHHLSDPMIGLNEMTRVAAKAVSLTEPTTAAATRIAVHLGISVMVEEAGNVVARMDIDKTEQALEARGLEIVHSHRYAMFYRHEPGWAMHLASSRVLVAAAKAGWMLANTALGRFGNKMAITAKRRARPA